MRFPLNTSFFFFNDTATTEIYTLSLHDALPISHDDLTIYDHGALTGHMGSKGITCEGLPTGRTDLIKDGKLVGLLSSFYETERMLRDPAAKEKLGVPPEEDRKSTRLNSSHGYISYAVFC